MANCIRCGQEAHQYGSDGLPYCDSCSFYGLNKQCQRCGMYLPTLELQMYNGQWHCQYCVMDIRDAERRSTESYSKTERKSEQYAKRENCERCGVDLQNIMYYFNGRKLCGTCLETERGQTDYTSPPPMKINLTKNSSIIVPIRIIVHRVTFDIVEWVKGKLKIKNKRKKRDIETVWEKEKADPDKNKKSKKKSQWDELKKD